VWRETNRPRHLAASPSLCPGHLNGTTRSPPADMHTWPQLLLGQQRRAEATPPNHTTQLRTEGKNLYVGRAFCALCNSFTRFHSCSTNHASDNVNAIRHPRSATVPQTMRPISSSTTHLEDLVLELLHVCRYCRDVVRLHVALQDVSRLFRGIEAQVGHLRLRWPTCIPGLSPPHINTRQHTSTHTHTHTRGQHRPRLHAATRTMSSSIFST